MVTASAKWIQCHFCAKEEIIQAAGLCKLYRSALLIGPVWKHFS